MEASAHIFPDLGIMQTDGTSKELSSVWHATRRQKKDDETECSRITTIYTSSSR